MSVIVKKKR